jgi:Phage tail baseplate hub (GPD)
MNTDRTRAWGEVSGTYIARQIAGEHGLRSVLTSSDWVLPYEVQANESDFHFLNRIADKLGYRFWVSGGTLYFTDPAVILQGSAGQAIPEFYMDKSFLYHDTLRDFHMLRGDNIPGAVQSARTIYGINESTGQPFSTTASNALVTSGISQVTSEWPVSDVNQAQHLVNAWQSRSQFWLAATAEVYGNSYIYPGKLIYLRGNQLNTAATGYWIVSSSCQVMKASGTTDPTKDRYVTRVSILKNTPAALPAIRNVTKISPEFTACNLLNGTWRASSQTITYENR